jgi:hypothetical protein
MPAPVCSTIDATAVSPTRRERVSIMSGLTSGVRRISAAFGGSRALAAQGAPALTSNVQRAIGAPPLCAVAAMANQATITDSARTGRLLGSPAGRTRTSGQTGPVASTKVTAVGTNGSSSGFVGVEEVARSSISSRQSGWGQAQGSERPQARLSSDASNTRPSSDGPRVVSMMAPSSNMSRSGAGAGGRAVGRRRSSVHYRVGGVSGI